MAEWISWEQLASHEAKLQKQKSLIERRMTNIRAALDSGNHSSSKDTLTQMLKDTDLKLFETKINLKNNSIALAAAR